MLSCIKQTMQFYSCIQKFKQEAKQIKKGGKVHVGVVSF